MGAGFKSRCFTERLGVLSRCFTERFRVFCLGVSPWKTPCAHSFLWVNQKGLFHEPKIGGSDGGFGRRDNQHTLGRGVVQVRPGYLDFFKLP